ncbi:DUF6114 domain-containing protein [Nocardiopsis quinghaiensis]|uniref:DUF6114 domain-containing protein n=1 Tax=Nocardiopsis quinghaiensis TaxID=464995 RepID=UPI00123A0606|nr:DUF6114 domain-containing protein [Nocardiopsis quinghaiensis]
MAHALSLLRAGRGHFRGWRRGRPFWGGLLLVAAGIELLVAPAAQSLILPIDLIIYAGIAGVSGALIAVLLITLGVLSWLQPAQHIFFGVVGLLLALVSFVTSNFGGFVIGMLLGIVGGSLVFAWAPIVRRRPRRRRRKGAHEAPQDRDGDRDEDSAAGDGADTIAETRTETRVNRVGTGTDPDTAPTRSVVAGSFGVPAHTEPAGAPDEGVGASDETVSDPGSGFRPLAALALPLAAAMILASAPSSALDWPWDDWFSSPSDEEEQPADGASPSPSEEPPPSPGTDPGTDPGADPTAGPAEPGGDGEGGGGEETPEDPEDGEPEEDEDEESEEGTPEECELRTDESALTESEEEFLAAVRDCQAAQDEGRLPEVSPEEEYPCFQGAVSTSGLTSGRLTMSGARYEGVVECPTVNGPRRYIRLTMSRADFSGAELWFEDAGTRMSLGLPTMTMDGTVEMHITRMHVRILGIPLTFTPDFPPPLLLPYMVVTDVEVDNPMAGTDLMNITDLNGRFAGS